MKRILIFLIKTYQKIPLKSHSYCTFTPTCSNYGIEAITNYGSIKGTYLTIKRILRCNPFSKGGYDPVPIKEKNMKKKLLIICVLLLTVLTGCFKRDNMEGINIITTYYPIEFITNKLYGKNSIVNSIYPDGVNVFEYKLNDKQLNDYSKKNLFIYLGLTNDKDIAVDLINRNNNLLIIDSTFGMELNYGIEELWLNPSNLLMISQNIKNGLQEYINSAYLNKEIDKNYEALKVELSELDAEIKLTAENSTNKTLVVSNDVFKFLEKYGFEVISLDPDTAVEKTIVNVQNRINSGNTKYIFTLESDVENEHIKTIEQNTNVKIITLKGITNITDEERNNHEDYIKIMTENLESIKKESYAN